MLDMAIIRQKMLIMDVLVDLGLNICEICDIFGFIVANGG